MSARQQVEGTEVESLSVTRNRCWKVAAPLCVGALLVVGGLFWDTLASMVHIWMRSETFAHGFLIAPISVFLIWHKRHELESISPAPSIWGLVLVLASGAAWLLASLVDVLVVQQLAVVTLIPGLIATLLGFHVLRAIAFPIGFLYFSVPIGEGLIPPLMDFTAAFTVAVLRLSAIPVYAEGTFFSIPSGDWSVVEGCSGVRYLIASVAVGALYAYLNYVSIWRRLAFMVLATLLPIVANGMRAYLIVMIAHYSDMRLALGVDHFIYGWVFFGLVMLLMFMVGRLWSDVDGAAPSKATPVAHTDTVAVPRSRFALTAVFGILSAALWPIWAGAIEHRLPISAEFVRIAAPQGTGACHAVEASLADWKPRFIGADGVLSQTYRCDGIRVGLYVAFYKDQRQGAELVNSQNVLVPQKHPKWRQIIAGPREPDTIAGPMHVSEAIVRSAEVDLLVWRWNWVSGSYTLNPYWTKILEAWNKLRGGLSPAAGIVLYTPLTDDKQQAVATLERYMSAMAEDVEGVLHDSSRAGLSL